MVKLNVFHFKISIPNSIFQISIYTESRYLILGFEAPVSKFKAQE